MSVRETAKKHGVKYHEHRDGTASVKYSRTYRGGDLDQFYRRLLAPARAVGKVLEKEGYEYVSSPYNFKYHNYPEVKVKITWSK